MKHFNLFLIALMVSADFAFAEGSSTQSAGMIAIGTGVAIGLAALGGTLGQGKAISSALDSIGRNPSAQAKVFIPMLLGLALVESLVILGFVIANKLAGIAAQVAGIAG